MDASVHSKCALATPCERAECDFCSPEARCALEASAAVALIPPRKNQKIAITRIYWPILLGDSVQEVPADYLTGCFGRIVSAAAMPHARALAGFRFIFAGPTS